MLTNATLKSFITCYISKYVPLPPSAQDIWHMLLFLQCNVTNAFKASTCLLSNGCIPISKTYQVNIL